MFITKHGARLVPIWVIVFAVFASCQSDPVNNPLVPAASTQVGLSTSSEKGDNGSATLPDAHPGSSPQSLLGDIIGGATRLVSGFVTPLNGGTLNLLNSRLVVQPLAVLTPRLVTFSMTTVQPVGLPGALNKVYDFYPEGLNFLVPSMLYIAFSDAGVGGGNPYQYRFYYFNPTTNAWDPQPTTVDDANQQFVVTLNHFSRYAFGR